MYLNKEDEAVLDGEQGKGKALAMRLLYNIGDFYKAEGLIKIGSTQISGVSYSYGGEALVRLLEKFVDAKVKVQVPSYTNTAGMDLVDHEEFGYSGNYVKRQKRIIELYGELGVYPSATCTPYYVGVIPGYGEHVSWSESSSVVFANSYFGARTNRESGPSSLAAAILGKTPYYGLHMGEMRVPDILVKIRTELQEGDLSMIGLLLGKKLTDKIPYIRGLKGLELFPNGISADDVKELSAAIATGTRIPMMHIKDVTPESKYFRPGKHEDKITIDREDIDDMIEELAPDSLPDAAVIGCPHMSIDELMRAGNIMKHRRVKKDAKLLFFVARATLNMAESMGLIGRLKEKGAIIMADTCMVADQAIRRMEFGTVVTNSMKAYTYLEGTTEAKRYFQPFNRAIESVTEAV